MAGIGVEEAKALVLAQGYRLLELDRKSRNKVPGDKGVGYVCPLCGSGSGKNGTGMTTKDGVHFRCWGCMDKAQDIIELMARRDHLEGAGFIAQLRHCCELMGIGLDPSREYSGPGVMGWDDTISAESPAPAEPPRARRKGKGGAHSPAGGGEAAAPADAGNPLGSIAPLAPAAAALPAVEARPLAPLPPLSGETAGDLLEWAAHVGECDYLTRRGITPEVQRHFGCGYCPDWRNPKAGPHAPATPRVIIPTSFGSYIARDIRPNLAGDAAKYAKLKVGSVHLFNAGIIDRLAEWGGKALFVVEGEIDAMSVKVAGYDAVALGGGNKELLIRELKRVHFMRQGMGRGEAEEMAKGDDLKLDLGALPTLVLALDNDEAGRAFTRGLRERLEACGVSYHSPNTGKLYGGKKDANEALIADGEGLWARLTQLAKSKEELYNEGSAAGVAGDFLRDFLEGKNPSPIPTGFRALDAALDGGLYEGLYIIGAISSLGKTTFALQVMDNVARGGHDALIFSLEMSSRELVAKSISRLTMLGELNRGGAIDGMDARARSVRDLTSSRGQNTPEQVRIVEAAASEYATYAGRVFIREGIGDCTCDRIRYCVEEHIRCRGQAPIVLIDYLQIIAPSDDRLTERQAMDRALLDLKRLSRDLKIPVITISSFNRDSYDKKISMKDFKESGAIEYSSDVLIGLQLQGSGESFFNVDEAKAQNPRRIELKILKNRNGQTGGIVPMSYFTRFNLLWEM